MRILHTSDWHLGRSFGEHKLLDQQALFVDWLVEVTRDYKINLVVIAGDVYDRSVPPADAVSLFHEALGRLVEAGADVVAVAGNHDSSLRFDIPDSVLASGIILRGGFGGACDPVTMRYADGPLSVVAVPFLDPLLVPPQFSAALRADIPGGDGDRDSPCGYTHESLLRAVFSRVRRRLDRDTRSLVISHAFVTGASPSDSERSLAVGDAAMVSSSVLSGFDYCALGHLHRPQLVAGDERIRYSGSPLAYSFSETTQKEVVIVELDPDGDARAKALPVDVGRKVTTVRGTLEQLIALEANDTDWVRAELTETYPVVDASRRLRPQFRHLVEIVRRPTPVPDSSALTTTTAKKRDSHDLAGDFVASVSANITSDETYLLKRAIADAERRCAP